MSKSVKAIFIRKFSRYGVYIISAVSLYVGYRIFVKRWIVKRRLAEAEMYANKIYDQYKKEQENLQQQNEF